MIVAILVLGSLVLGQFWLILRLLDRLLVQAKIPSLQPAPVHSAPPVETPDTKRYKFSVPINP